MTPKIDGDFRTAFTMVELLVVLSVIAILAALLLPVLSAAKARSKAASCGNNARQLVLAWTMYYSDHGDRLVGNMPCGIAECAPRRT